MKKAASLATQRRRTREGGKEGTNQRNQRKEQNRKKDRTIDELRKSKGLHSVSAYRHGLYIYRSRPAGVVQSRHAFVVGTVSTWAR